MDTKRRVALVSGGMGGLGEAICIKLAALGYTVVATHSPTNAKSQRWLRDMRERGYAFHAYACDVANWESCVACVREISDAVGPVDVLVNNAGITRDMTFRKMDRVNWDVVMRTNLDSCFNMTKQVCDGMLERGWGRIINISSVNGQKGAFGQTNYSAAKAGMHGFTKALALEVARKGITVNTISPGYIGTADGDGYPERCPGKQNHPADTHGTLGETRRGCRSGRLSGQRRGRIRYRGQHCHQRRSAHAVNRYIPHSERTKYFTIDHMVRRSR